MPGEDTTRTAEETSTTTLDQSIVDNVSKKNVEEKIFLNQTVNVENTLTSVDLVEHQSLDDLINNSLSPEIELIQCYSSTSKYTLCEDGKHSSDFAPDDKTPSYSQSETDLTRLKKRKLDSPDQSENTKLKLRRFVNPKLRSKHVSFVLQNTPQEGGSATTASSEEPNSTRAVTPANTASTPQVDAQDARDYVVQNQYINIWRLDLMAKKNAAKTSARANAMHDSLTTNMIPLWCYGLTMPPHWISPLSDNQIDVIHNSARRMAEVTENDLRVELAGF